MLVVDLRNSDDALALTLLSLQGIVNREDPRIYIILDKYSEFWLQYAQSRVGIRATRIDSPSDLITQFKPAIKGIVVYDPEKDFTLDSVSSFASFYRRMLGQVNPMVAGRLAHKNLEDLLAGVDLSSLSSTTQSVTQTTSFASTSVSSLLTTQTIASVLISSSEVVRYQSPTMFVVMGVAAFAILALVFLFSRRRMHR